MDNFKYWGDPRAFTIDQLNDANQAEVQADQVTFAYDSTEQKTVATGHNGLSGKVLLDGERWDLAELFPMGVLIDLDAYRLSGVDLSSGITGRMALDAANTLYGATFKEENFNSADLDKSYPAATGVSGIQLVLRAVETDPWFSGNLPITFYSPTVLASKDNAGDWGLTGEVDPSTAYAFDLMDIDGVTDVNATIKPLVSGKNPFVLLVNWQRSGSTTWSNVELNVDIVQALSVSFGSWYLLAYTLDEGQTWKARQVYVEDDASGVVNWREGIAWGGTDAPLEWMMRNHVYFLNRNTGAVVDPKTDRKVINEYGVLLNNRHFTYETRQEGQPDGDATTEGQSLLILGAAIAGDSIEGTAFKNRLRTLAENSYYGYSEYFYGKVPVPETAYRWTANWIVNGKAPVLAHYPLAPAGEFPTHGGYKDVVIPFVSGVGQIPHGADSWGEYLDVIGAVYEGRLGWNAINATVYATQDDGSIDWTAKGKVHEVEKIYLWNMHCVDADGSLIEEFIDTALIGRIELKDKTISSSDAVVIKMSYAVRLPVEHGGYMIQTNEPQHNRPIQVPVGIAYMGNASDAEQWFCEAAWSMWLMSGNDVYRRGFEASRYTINEYTTIDANDKFIRQVIGDARYDTDGIAYMYSYPSGEAISVSRTVEGYLEFGTARAEGLQIFIAQKAIPFRVSGESILRITYGGPANFSAILAISPDKSEEKKVEYALELPASSEISVFDIPVSELKPKGANSAASDPQSGVPVDNEAGAEIPLLANLDWSDASTNVNNKLDLTTPFGRPNATVFRSTATGSGQQVDMKLKHQAPITAIAYRSQIDYNIRVEDANGWRWWAMIPYSEGWKQLDLSDTSLWSLSGYQPNGTGDEPTSYVPGAGPTYYSILADDTSAAGNFIEIYCVNAFPPPNEEAGEAVVDPVSGYATFGTDQINWSQNNTASSVHESALPNGRASNVLHCVATAADQQVELLSTTNQVVRNIVYKASIDYNMRVEDADGWRWWVMMAASPSWIAKRVLIGDWKLSGYQPNHDDTVDKPTVPNFGAGGTSFVVLPDDASVAGDWFSIYVINNYPPVFEITDGYTMLFELKGELLAAGSFFVGDCTILKQRLDALPYTPGLIPFSNNYVPDAPTFDSWHGQPYPGYQHPWVFLDSEREDRELMLNNVIDFWYDSQEWYHDKFGIYGPGASAYVWDRWDAPSGSKVNDFTMYHFGDQTAWSGYQPRAFFSAVRLYAGLMERGRVTPMKLVTYIDRWIDYLADFINTHGTAPTDFPMETIPVPIENDFTGHMSGLWLAGLSLAGLHNFPNGNIVPIARKVYDEIRENMILRYGHDDIMNGSWSPAGDPSHDGKDGMFYGFWTGEILRGIGYYRSLVMNATSLLVKGEEYDLTKIFTDNEDVSAVAITTPDKTMTSTTEFSLSLLTTPVPQPIGTDLVSALTTPGSILDEANDASGSIAALIAAVNTYYPGKDMTGYFGKRRVIETTYTGSTAEIEMIALGPIDGQTAGYFQGTWMIYTNLPEHTGR